MWSGGRAAFSGYLGDDDKEQWKQWDACELLRAYSGPKLPCLVDTGTADNFYKVRLYRRPGRSRSITPPPLQVPAVLAIWSAIFCGFPVAPGGGCVSLPMPGRTRVATGACGNAYACHIARCYRRHACV